MTDRGLKDLRKTTDPAAWLVCSDWLQEQGRDRDATEWRIAGRAALFIKDVFDGKILPGDRIDVDGVISLKATLTRMQVRIHIGWVLGDLKRHHLQVSRYAIIYRTWFELWRTGQREYLTPDSLAKEIRDVAWKLAGYVIHG